MTVVCADVNKLLAASRAVPDVLRQKLGAAPQVLSWAINAFNSAYQEPRILPVSELLSQEAGERIREGKRIDEFLARTAEAFRIAGHRGEPGFIGPVNPGIFYADETALLGTLARLNQPLPDPFGPPGSDPFADGRMRRRDGHVELRGPDGQWYVVSTVPPVGAVLVSNWEGHHDFGNPNYALVVSASSLLLGEWQPITRPAPPQAYQHVKFDDDGNVVIDIPGGTGPSEPYKKPKGNRPEDPATAPPPLELQPGRRPAVRPMASLLTGLLAGYSQAADSRYSGNMAAQVQYYVDPTTGKRVAVVDAASISYYKNDPRVYAGRLTFDDKGRPELTPRPRDPGEPCVTRPVISNPRVTVRGIGSD